MKFLKPRLLVLSAVAGALAGLAVAVFFHLLAITTRLWETDPRLTLALPITGLVIGILYKFFGDRAHRGTALILDEIHDPREVLPARMAPLVIFATLLTHLGGGSAGREGAAVQIGASLADQLGRWVHLNTHERRALLMGGMGAGFAAAMGTPLAGIVFGLEVIEAGRIRFGLFLECAVASLVGAFVAHHCHSPHASFDAVGAIPFEWPLPFLAALFGLACGFFARGFVFAEHGVAALFKRLVPWPVARPVIGGAMLAAIYFGFGLFRYGGLGIAAIQNALRFPASWADPFMKLGFTALTLGTGFKGGEFVPLVFVGTTFGSAFAASLGLSVTVFGALGCAAVFGAAANTPFACAVMAAELFGWNVLPYALIACWCGYFSSGHPGIYGMQPLRGRKLRFRGL